MSDTSLNTHASTQQTAPKTDSTTPDISGQSTSSGARPYSSNSQVNRNQKPGNRSGFRGSRYNKKKRSGGAPKQANVPNRAPLNEYLSVCCGLPARKPQTGRKEQIQNPENGKSKEQAKGLGKWHCSGCGKVSKVTVIYRLYQGTIKTTEPPTGNYIGIKRTSSPEVTNETLPT